MIPPRARRLWGKGVDVRWPRLNDRRSLFGRAVLHGGQVKAMPMNEIGVTRLVDNVDLDRHAFAQAESRAGHRPVIAGRLDHLIWRDLKSNWGDPDCVIKADCGRGRLGSGARRE